MAQIPVLKIDDDGNQVSSSHHGAPCVMMRYSFQSMVEKPGGGVSLDGIHSALALLDTGADHNLICESLIPSTAACVEQVRNSGVTGWRMCANYRVTLHIPEADMMHATGVIAMEPCSTRPYKMILGRKFLQMTRFAWEPADGITALEWAGNPLAR